MRCGAALLADYLFDTNAANVDALNGTLLPSDIFEMESIGPLYLHNEPDRSTRPSYNLSSGDNT